MQVKLHLASEENILQLLQWFPDQAAVDIWGGPNFRYPFDVESFTEDLNVFTLNSYVLLDDDGHLAAFGQFYERVGRCHVGRLAVNPAQRGRGVVAVLLQGLLDLGASELSVSEASLFVLSDNIRAIRAYQKFGFVEADYPEPMPLENCLYMVKAITSQ